LVRIDLGRITNIGIVEQVLDTQQKLERQLVHFGDARFRERTDLLDRDRWLPALLLIQDRETDSAGRVDVRVEESRVEFAWLVSQCLRLSSPSIQLTLRRFCWVL
jgi:hypothetical protein